MPAPKNPAVSPSTPNNAAPCKVSPAVASMTATSEDEGRLEDRASAAPCSAPSGAVSRRGPGPPAQSGSDPASRLRGVARASVFNVNAIDTPAASIPPIAPRSKAPVETLQCQQGRPNRVHPPSSQTVHDDVGVRDRPGNPHQASGGGKDERLTPKDGPNPSRRKSKCSEHADLFEPLLYPQPEEQARKE